MAHIKSFHWAPHSLVQSAITAQVTAGATQSGMEGGSDALQNVTQILEQLPHPRLISAVSAVPQVVRAVVGNPVSPQCIAMMLDYAWARIRDDKTKMTEIENEWEKSSCNSIGWLTAAFDYLKAFVIDRDKIPYVGAASPPTQEFVYAIPEQDSYCIGILGDWGTGEPVAQLVANAMTALGVDLIVHVGDIYYAGTAEQAHKNFVKMLKNARAGSNVPVYNLPGNHDMYSGGAPFYDTLSTLNAGASFPHSSGAEVPVQEASFFCLRNSWLQLQGMDTGYYDSDLFDVANDTTQLHPDEAAWHIDKIDNADGRSVFLFSHHQGWSRFFGIGTGTPVVGHSLAAAKMPMACYNPHLQTQLAPISGKVSAWFWGHEHVLEVYDQEAIAGSTVGTGSQPLSQLFPWVAYGACIGNSAFPMLTSDQPYNIVAPTIQYNSSYVMAVTGETYNHGFVILEVTKSGSATATYYSLPADGSSSVATVLTPPSTIS